MKLKYPVEFQKNPSKKSIKKFLLNPNKSLKCIILLAQLWCIWPLSEKRDLFVKIFQELGLWFIFINMICCVAAVSMFIYVHNDDPGTLGRNISILMTICEAITHLILYWINRSDFQLMLRKVFSFLKSCSRHEKFVVKENFKPFLVKNMVLISSYYLTTIIFFTNAVILVKLPTDALYPFSIEPPLIYALIYLHQIFCTLQVNCIMIIDFIIIIPFWYAGVRIKLLEDKLTRVRSEKQLRECVIEHQYIISYVQFLVKTVRFVIYKSIVIVGIVTITSIIQILYFNIGTVVPQFFFVMLTSSFRIFVLSSTVDDTKQMNEDLRWSVYRIELLEGSAGTSRNLQIFIHRCQTPLVVYRGRMLIMMSLHFYSKLVYFNATNLATLHAIIEDSI